MGKIFAQYNGSSSFLPYITNEQQFILARRRISDQLTPRQSQVALNAATADLDNDQTDDDTPVIQPNDSAMETTVTTENKPATSSGNKLFIHYRHEKRFRSFKRDLHRVYDNVFRGTPAMDVRLIVGTRNRRDANNELVHKKPKQWLLQNKAKKIRNKYVKFLRMLPL